MDVPIRVDLMDYSVFWPNYIMDVLIRVWFDGLRYVLTWLSLDAPIMIWFDRLKFVLITLSFRFCLN